MNPEKVLDGLPVWDKAIAKWMQPAEPFFRVLLIGLALLCVWSAWKMKPQYQALVIAFLVSP